MLKLKSFQHNQLNFFWTAQIKIRLKSKYVSKFLVLTDILTFYLWKNEVGVGRLADSPVLGLCDLMEENQKKDYLQQ